MLQVLSSLVTGVVEPAGTEEDDGDDDDGEEDVMMEIGAPNCVVEQAIALLNDKDFVAFLVRVVESSVEQTSLTFSGEERETKIRISGWEKLLL